MYKIYIKENISSIDLLKEIMGEFNITDEIIYEGKPHLKNNSFYFNISNSDNVTVCAISNNEIGVDIEKITYRHRVLNKVFTDDEKCLVKTRDDFTRIWVKKECYVKYLGIGLSYGLINVDTTKIKGFRIKKYKNFYIGIYEDKEKNT